MRRNALLFLENNDHFIHVRNGCKFVTENHVYYTVLCNYCQFINFLQQAVTSLCCFCYENKYQIFKCMLDYKQRILTSY